MSHYPEELGREGNVELVRRELYDLLQKKFLEQDGLLYNPGFVVEDLRRGCAVTIERHPLGQHFLDGQQRPDSVSTQLHAYSIEQYDSSDGDYPACWMYVSPQVLDEDQIECSVNLHRSAKGHVDESNLLEDMRETLIHGIYTEGSYGLPPDLYVDSGDTHLLVGRDANAFYSGALHDQVSSFLHGYPHCLRGYSQDIPSERILWDLRGIPDNTHIRLAKLETSRDKVRNRYFRALQLEAKYKDNVKVSIRVRFDPEGHPRNGCIEFSSSLDGSPVVLTPTERGVIFHDFRIAELFPRVATPLENTSGLDLG